MKPNQSIFSPFEPLRQAWSRASRRKERVAPKLLQRPARARTSRQTPGFLARTLNAPVENMTTTKGDRLILPTREYRGPTPDDVTPDMDPIDVYYWDWVVSKYVKAGPLSTLIANGRTLDELQAGLARWEGDDVRTLWPLNAPTAPSDGTPTDGEVEVKME
jgi:hypothetical protein